MTAQSYEDAIASIESERDDLRALNAELVAALQGIIRAYDAEDHPVPSKYLEKHINDARQTIAKATQP